MNSFQQFSEANEVYAGLFNKNLIYSMNYLMNYPKLYKTAWLFLNQIDCLVEISETELTFLIIVVEKDVETSFWEKSFFIKTRNCSCNEFLSYAYGGTEKNTKTIWTDR
jgi:hypothetical protein